MGQARRSAVTPDDATPGGVVCGHLDVDDVSGEDANAPAATHATGRLGEQLEATLQLHLEGRVGEHLHNGAPHPYVFLGVLSQCAASPFPTDSKATAGHKDRPATDHSPARPGEGTATGGNLGERCDAPDESPGVAGGRYRHRSGAEVGVGGKQTIIFRHTCPGWSSTTTPRSGSVSPSGPPSVGVTRPPI